MKQHIFWGVSLLALLAAGCSNEDLPLKDFTAGKTIVLNADFQHAADARLNYQEASPTTGLKVAWTNNEQFTMYQGKSTSGTVFSNAEYTLCPNRFEGTAPEGTGKYYAVYGGDHITNSGGTLTVDISNQTGTLNDNGIKEFMLAESEALTGATTLHFKHKLAVLRLELTLPEDVKGKVNVTVEGLHKMADYDLSSGTYTYTDENKGDITATNGNEGFTISEDHKVTAYVAAFPEEVDENQATIFVKGRSDSNDSGDSDDYYCNLANAITLPMGKVVNVNLAMTKVLRWTSSTTEDEVRAAVSNNNLVIASEKDLTVDDFTTLRNVLQNSGYADGSINLTLLDQTSLPYNNNTGALELLKALKSVFAPNVKEIETYAFFGCSFLSKVSLPKATSVGKESFFNCSSLSEVSLPKVTSVGENSFFGCTSLSEVSLPEVTSVGESSFQGCTSLSKVSLPKATSVGKTSFLNCSSLSEVSLPEVTSVGESSFLNCSSLSEVSLPKATSLGESSFVSCKKLETLYLPAATNVHEYAFSNCDRSKISLTTNNASNWYKTLGGDETDNYGWKSLNIIKTNFKSEYTSDDYKTWSEENCGSAPTADQMMMYLGAGVYWDNGDEGDNKQTYTVNGNDYHIGLWVMKKAYIEGFSAGTAKKSKNVTPQKGRPADINEYFFLPAAGYYSYTYSKFNDAGSIGYYWSTSSDGDDYAYRLNFGSGYAYVSSCSRNRGCLPMIAE